VVLQTKNKEDHSFEGKRKTVLQRSRANCREREGCKVKMVVRERAWEFERR